MYNNENNVDNGNNDNTMTTSSTRKRARNNIDISPGLEAGLTEDQCNEIVNYRNSIIKVPLTQRAYDALTKKIAKVSMECDTTIDDVLALMQGADRKGKPWVGVEVDWVKNIVKKRRDEDKAKMLREMSGAEFEAYMKEQCRLDRERKEAEEERCNTK